MNSIRAWLHTRLRAFAGDRRANVAMIFALSLVPLTVAAGVGLDFARGMMVRSAMSEALDAAALAVGGTTNKPSSCDTSQSTPSQACKDLQTLAQKYFEANYVPDTSYGSPSTVVVKVTASNAVLSVTDTMPTTLLKLVKIDTVPITSSSTVVWGQSKLWVALVLDNSGSMCQPDGQPCINDRNSKTKIYQLKDATKQLLTKLQSAAASPGDVKVSIVPFNREVSVGTSYKNAAWLSWAFWEAEPPNAGLNNTTDLMGPGDSCPWSTNSQGYRCQSGSANGSSSTSSIPSSGLICPTIDNGRVNSERNDHYYNGCYTSVATGATKEVDSGKNSDCPSQYSNCTCYGKKSSRSRHCDANYYKHVWTPNNHSTWGGCITDRNQDYDIGNADPVGTQPSGFPADNPANPVNSSKCMYGIITPLEYDFDDLASQVDAMQAGGSTNQAIGVAHGWQSLTTGDPYGAPPVPDNTSRYIILLSDGLNTQDRWWGDGSTEGSSDDDKIDKRMSDVCTAAKNDKVVIYSLYVHVNGGGNSDALKDCATDSSKYYDITSSDQIATAFADIAQQITNLRVAQ